MSLFDGMRRALLVHAHPDDETLATGGLVALLRQRGVAVTVVTATRGERGEVVPGPLQALEGTPALGSHRAQELAEAMRALGVLDQRFLGAVSSAGSARVAGAAPRMYADSGMEWAADGVTAIPAADAPRDAFSRADPEEAIADLLAVIDEVAPDAVIGYEQTGGYGHPDHRRAYEVASAAAARRGIRYIAVVPAHLADGRIETVDISAVMDAKRAALRAHASQLTVAPDGASFVLSGGQRHVIAQEELFRAE